MMQVEWISQQVANAHISSNEGYHQLIHLLSENELDAVPKNLKEQSSAQKK